MLRPRTIRAQLIVGLLTFEILLVAIFAGFVVHEHASEMHQRDLRRLEYQVNMLALLAQDAIAENRLNVLQRTIATMVQAPSVRTVQMTDTAGRTMLSSDATATGKLNLSAAERSHLAELGKGSVFELPGGLLEAVAPVIVGGQVRAVVWICPTGLTGQSELERQLRLTLAFAIVGAAGCVLLAEFLARSITRPLSRLLLATRRLIRDPEDTSTLPSDGSASTEVYDLTTAFNLMMASVEEQRTGLTGTLALLDSMLAHAPIGMAFFDSKGRFIRMNQFLADMNGLPVGRHIGRNATEIFAGPTGKAIDDGIQRVFATSEPFRDLEVHIGAPGEDGRVSTWLVNIYPVRTANQGVRWVGAVIVDTTGLKRSEDALRRTEKLAAVGQLSASIAHEINNPLEAITNLLYLLRRVDRLDEVAGSYVEQAEHEVARMSEIVQQTLRFHRQSTRKTLTNLSEILDSVLTLHRGKVVGQQIEVIRKDRRSVQLYCFSGEMRQLFNNLVGNAIDSMLPRGGRLIVEARNSHDWRDPSIQGVRIVITDTGCGMAPATQRRIFEPFFTTKEATGTGLGLWVSAEIVQKHEGTVRVRSRTAGDSRQPGTVFMVFLPSQTPVKTNRALAAEVVAAS